MIKLQRRWMTEKLSDIDCNCVFLYVKKKNKGKCNICVVVLKY